MSTKNIKPAAAKDTDETIIPPADAVAASKETNIPLNPVSVTSSSRSPDDSTIVGQKIQPSQPGSSPVAEAAAQKIPVERNRSRVWIPVAVILLLMALGGGGYIAFTRLLGRSAQIPPASQPVAVKAIAVAATTIPATQTPPGAQISSASYTCSDPIGCVKLGPTDPIHIAYLLAISGYNASLGIDSRRGVEMAIDEVGGEILEHPIKFDGQDDLCSENVGMAVGEKLASDPTIVAVIGTSCSATAWEAEPLLSRAGFVTISPSNTMPDLTNPTSSLHYAGYFRTAYNDNFQGAAAADFAYNFLGVRRAATIQDGDRYPINLQQVFAYSFKKLGGTITLQTSITLGQTDMSSVLASIAAGNPDLIYFPIFLPEGAFIIQQARTTPGLENTRLMSADGMWLPDVVKTSGEAVEGFMVTYYTVQDTAHDAFVKKYQAMFGELPINMWHAHAYDAFNIVKAAIEKVGVQEPDGTLYIPRQALRDAVAATKDFQGVTGVLTCNPDGDCANPVIGVYVYHAGQFPPELIWPTKNVNSPAGP